MTDDLDRKLREGMFPGSSNVIRETLAKREADIPADIAEDLRLAKERVAMGELDDADNHSLRFARAALALFEMLQPHLLKQSIPAIRFHTAETDRLKERVAELEAEIHERDNVALERERGGQDPGDY